MRIGKVIDGQLVNFDGDPDILATFARIWREWENLGFRLILPPTQTSEIHPKVFLSSPGEVGVVVESSRTNNLYFICDLPTVERKILS